MIKKSIIVTTIFIISTFIQLISQIVVTKTFGAKLDLDIFLAAVAIPTIIVTVIYGTLNDAFLPLYGEEKTKKNNEADEYFYSTLTYLTIISFLVAWIMGFFTKPISYWLYQGRGEEFINSVSIHLSYMLYSIPLSVIAALLGTYFYIRKKFIRFPLAQALGSVVNLVIIILLAPHIHSWALTIAFVLNIAFQIFLVIPNSIFKFQIKKINLLPIIFAWIPLIIGSFALRSDTLLIRSLASSLPTGYMVYLNLISKIFSLATGVMTIGLQILLLPHLVEYINNKNYKRAFHVVNKAKLVAIGVSILATICIALFSPFFINLLFIGGKFTKNDAMITSSLIPLFILPAIGWGIVGIFLQPLLAIKKQTAVGVISCVSLLLGWLVGYVVKQFFGPLAGITGGLIILLFVGIIGSEILWQYYKTKHLQTVPKSKFQPT